MQWTKTRREDGRITNFGVAKRLFVKSGKRGRKINVVDITNNPNGIDSYIVQGAVLTKQQIKLGIERLIKELTESVQDGNLLFNFSFSGFVDKLNELKNVGRESPSAFLVDPVNNRESNYSFLANGPFFENVTEFPTVSCT